MRMIIYSCTTPIAQMPRKRCYLRVKLVLVCLLFSRVANLSSLKKPELVPKKSDSSVKTVIRRPGKYSPLSPLVLPLRAPLRRFSLYPVKSDWAFNRTLLFSLCSRTPSSPTIDGEMVAPASTVVTSLAKTGGLAPDSDTFTICCAVDCSLDVLTFCSSAPSVGFLYQTVPARRRRYSIEAYTRGRVATFYFLCREHQSGFKTGIVCFQFRVLSCD